MAGRRAAAPLPGRPPVGEELPQGGTLRRFRAGDEEAWAAVLNCGELGAWDAERARQARGRGIDDRIWLVWEAARPVATACVCIHAGPEGPAAEIGWVAVVPECRGRRRGALVTLAACHGARDCGFDEVFLLTDDHRLPAIKTYLNLGFQPDPWHASHASRWAMVLKGLGIQTADERR